jgi:hypothetical protein
MPDNSIIKSILDPTIILDELVYDDMDEGTGEIGEKYLKTFGTLGMLYPLVQINNYVFKSSEIKKMTIDSTGFLPTIQLKLHMRFSGAFVSNGIPKDGDVVSIFINQRQDVYKPIRNDYLITSISSSGTNSEGVGGILYIEGELRIPRLYDIAGIAINDTSFESLKLIATDLGLGFSTNEDSTDDLMTWFSGVDTYENFIKHLTTHAWKDENSFFKIFIDIYYNLNFVNVNHQFKDDNEFLAGSIDNITIGPAYGDEEGKNEPQDSPVVFSNHRKLNTTSFYITEYNPINIGASIAKKYGYTFEPVFFEQNTLENWSIPMEPLITEGSEEEKILLRGRPNEEFYKTQIKKQWLGIQYTADDHNTHENFMISKVQNMINNQNTDKFNVRVLINRINFNIFKYGRFPFIFFVQQDVLRMMQEMKTDDYAELKTDMAVDSFYTGWWLLKGFKIIFVDDSPDETNKFRQEFILSRRELPLPATTSET